MNPAELSAYLDGELPPERTREVERLLAADPGLRAELDALRRSDAAFRAAAQTAAFRPPVRLPASDIDARSLLATACLALVVALARIAP
ncbi:MAG TPA: zf-HC2 domain-containing protein, partial [Rhizomicrobium sp.]